MVRCHGNTSCHGIDHMKYHESHGNPARACSCPSVKCKRGRREGTRFIMREQGEYGNIWLQYTGRGKRVVPRLREFFRQGQAEVVSNSKNKILAT